MATFYSSIDTGAPSFATGSSPSAALKAILKGCLVNGYGAKPAAGWVLVDEGTNYLILRNAKSTGYICFNFSTASYVKIYLAATYTGVVSDVITGAGVKTGTASNNSAPQWLHIFHLTSNAARCWALVADSDSATLTFGGRDGNGTNEYLYLSGGANNRGTLCFGEDSAGNFLAIGGANVASAVSSLTYFYSGGMTVLRDPTTGLLVDTGSISPVTPLLSASSPSGSTVYPLVRVDLSRVSWMTTAKHAGFFRGLGYHPEAMGYLNYALRSVGRGSAFGDIYIGTVANPFELIPGVRVAPVLDYLARPGLFMTDDARFW